MSRTVHIGDQHAVYIGGLMHDIGTIVIYRYFNPEWKIIGRLVREKNYTWTKAEEEVLSCDHGMIGACLLMMWNIPQSVTDGIMYHHFPGNAADNIWNAKIIDIGNRFSKQADLSDHFSNFDDFINNNKHLVPLVEELGVEVSLSQELDLLDGVYGLMRNARSLLAKAEENKE